MTILFGIDDDLKASGGDDLILREVGMSQVVTHLNLTSEDVFGQTPPKSRSLWNVKLFPISQTAEESAQRAIEVRII